MKWDLAYLGSLNGLFPRISRDDLFLKVAREDERERGWGAG